MAPATNSGWAGSTNHFVRIVSKTVDELEIEEVFARNTKGGRASRYNSVMLLKVLIYCYMTGTYSSRQIAKQCRENVNVMWPTGFQKPDFRTINTFRSEKLKDSIEEIFVSTVKLLNRKNAHAPVEILFLTKRQWLRKRNPDIYRLTKFTSEKTAKAALFEVFNNF